MIFSPTPSCARWIHASARWNLSLLRLLKGDFLEAWPDFEYQWRLFGAVPRYVDRPRWDGSPLEGKTILLHPAQGLGDTLHFIRYAPMVKERGGTVLFECQPSLMRLLEGLAGIDRLIARGAPLPPFDVQTPLMSLPGLFGTTIATIPADIPYVSACPKLALQWQKELPAGFKIGIAWQGNPGHAGDRQRSVPLRYFESLAGLEGVRLVSLQKGPGTDQLAQWIGTSSQMATILDLHDRLESFADTAAVMVNLDLIVTVDTAVAHLAGEPLGVTAWVLLPFAPDWPPGCLSVPTVPGILPYGSFGRAGKETGAISLTASRRKSPYPSKKDKAVMATPMELCDLAVRYHRQGDVKQAEQLYRQVLEADPGHADAHANLGVALLTTGRKHEALACFRQALCSDPQHFYAHNNLGNALMEQGHMAEAVACFRQALRINPNYANAHYNLGNIAKDQGRLAEAIHCYREALRVNPDHVDAHNNLGNALFEQGQLAEAAECYRHVLRLNPRHANVYNNLGVVLRDQGQLAEAALCFRQAMSTDTRNVDAHINLAVIFDRLAKRDEAMDQYEQALRINPRHEITLWNRSLLRLQKGDFERGWADYEYRWAQPKKRARSFDKPRWDGSPLEGKTILVHAEQGLGDTIQFVRYVPLVQRRGGKILYECPPALQGILADFPGVEQLCPRRLAPLPPFDVQVPLLSLPLIFGTTLSSIPANIPCLRIDPSRLAFWRRELDPVDGFKVGIVWQGNPNNPGDARRSLPLAHFEALARVAGVKLLSLQVGVGTEQLAAASFPVTDLGTRFNPDSLDDLAAVLKNVDLVITVETAAAHLAGALEIPVGNLLAFNPCWRWLLEGLDSPWYPTMRLFRQSRLGEWGDVFEDVAAALHSLTHQNASTITQTM